MKQTIYGDLTVWIDLSQPFSTGTLLRQVLGSTSFCPRSSTLSSTSLSSGCPKNNNPGAMIRQITYLCTFRSSYVLKPTYFEFYQFHDNWINDRVAYRKCEDDTSWIRARLAAWPHLRCIYNFTRAILRLLLASDCGFWLSQCDCTIDVQNVKDTSCAYRKANEKK